jgi:hypothetical protein
MLSDYASPTLNAVITYLTKISQFIWKLGDVKYH